jgi:glycosyltransferase involved in cell wall biosynthesis
VKWGADIYYTPGGVMSTRVPDNCRSVTTLQNMLPFDRQQRQNFPFFSYLRFKLFLLRTVFLRSYKIADSVIFISKYSQGVVKKYLPDIVDKSKVIPLGINNNFIDNKVIYELPEGLRNTEFYLYVSHMDYYKSQKELVLSWKSLVDQGLKLPLVFVGSIVNEYGKEVISLIQKLNLEKNVIHLGHVDYSKLPGLYQASRALIFASKCECCPNILLEMLASKKIILCSNFQPMPEFGEDGVIYFDPSTISQLPKKVFEIENGVIEEDEILQKAHILSKKYRHDKTIDKTIKYILG